MADATAPPGACGLHVVKWPRRAGFHALIRLLLAVLILSGCGNPHIGSSTAPDFSLEALPVGETQGTAANPVKLSEIYAASPVLLVFWASWCPSCREEIPVLNAWHKGYAALGLKIFGVNVQENPERVAAFTAETPIYYPILLDRDAAVAGDYGLMGVPASVLVAKGGKILYYGFSLPKNIEELLSVPSV